jgi:small subunit ribosomal protein S18
MKTFNSLKSKSHSNIDDSIVNAMTGDISYEDLAKVEGISTVALVAKKTSSSSIFRKGDSKCAMSNIKYEYITYKNLKLISKYISPKGKILSTRSTGIKNKKKQRLLRLAINYARFLGILPYVKY